MSSNNTAISPCKQTIHNKIHNSPSPTGSNSLTIVFTQHKAETRKLSSHSIQADDPPAILPTTMEERMDLRGGGGRDGPQEQHGLLEYICFPVKTVWRWFGNYYCPQRVKARQERRQARLQAVHREETRIVD